MSEDKKEDKKQKLEIKPPANVVSHDFNKCKYSGCKTKPSRMNFCNDHFDWFKLGLITKEGAQAKDFEKKYNNWMRKKSA